MGPTPGATPASLASPPTTAALLAPGTRLEAITLAWNLVGIVVLAVVLAVQSTLVTVRVGPGLHTALGWWWADPAAASVLVLYGVRGARHARRE